MSEGCSGWICTCKVQATAVKTASVCSATSVTMVRNIAAWSVSVFVTLTVRGEGAVVVSHGVDDVACAVVAV